MKKALFKISAFVAILAIAGFFAFSGLVMFLWNLTLTPMFHLSAISLWQAAGILLLAKVLFGGRRRWGWHGGREDRMHVHCYKTAYSR